MKDYKLVWEENFDGDSLNMNNWNLDIGRGVRGWGNMESQYYTDHNHEVKDNVLTITARNEQPVDHNHENREGGLHGHDYTSTKITTDGKVSFKYGYFEIEAMVPYGTGTWPAVWFMPVEKASWPLCGEIDLMEHVGRDKDVIHHSLHTGTYNFKNNDSQYTIVNDILGVGEKFVKYAMEWTSEYFEFFIDGKSVGKLSKGQNGRDTDYSAWPFDKEFYLIINYAIGGYWGGEVDPNVTPSELKVRNIKYYR
jgi:beta-glucanase (GH16 family)